MSFELAHIRRISSSLHNGNTRDIKEAFVIGDDIAERLLNFAVGCLHVVVQLQKNAIGKQVSRQLTRCSTSGGANYGEARSAESAADFAHKVAIAAKEVGESVYWLKIAHRAKLVAEPDVTRWIQEGEELVPNSGRLSSHGADKRAHQRVDEKFRTHGPPPQQITGNRNPVNRSAGQVGPGRN
jgi:four helix bundle protein